MADTDQERTEQPTGKRLQQAREKGQIARSKELGTASVLLATVFGLLMIKESLAGAMVKVLTMGFTLDRDQAFDPNAMGVMLPTLLWELLQPLGLLFLPGFSTAEKVSDLSGRGVGMDVVKRNIESLRGEVNIITAPGEGSTVRIRLPLTLAIIDGFHVEVGGSAFVLPLDMMSECLDLPEVEMAPDTKQLQLRGEWIPYVSLRELFGFPPSAGAAEYVIIVQFGQSTAGIVVDELVGDVQAVIKPLGTMFRSLRGISGSTIMGNGTLALILDVPQIVHLAVRREGRLLSARHERLSRVEIACPDSFRATGVGKPQSYPGRRFRRTSWR